MQNEKIDFNKSVSIRLVNLTGQVVYNNKVAITKGRNVLNLPRLNKGLYVVSIQADAEIISKKIVIQ